MGAGLASNLAVISAMAAICWPRPALERLGCTKKLMNNSSVIVPDTPLWWLGDVFLLPLPVIGNVFSVGDLLLVPDAPTSFTALLPLDAREG